MRPFRSTCLAFTALLGFSGAALADATALRVAPSLSLARPCAQGESCFFTWTLATRLGHALNFAEDRYGKRATGWTLLGVEFTTRDAPQVWYPTFGGQFGTLVVQLTDSAAQDEKRALFQLAHEVVHLLSPAGPGASASVLEEGLSTYNSLEYLQDEGYSIGPEYIDSPRYESAYWAVVELKRQSLDFEGGIRVLRARTGSLSKISAVDVINAFPGASVDLAKQLAAAF